MSHEPMTRSIIRHFRSRSDAPVEAMMLYSIFRRSIIYCASLEVQGIVFVLIVGVSQLPSVLASGFFGEIKIKFRLGLVH